MITAIQTVAELLRLDMDWILTILYVNNNADAVCVDQYFIRTSEAICCRVELNAVENTIQQQRTYMHTWQSTQQRTMSTLVWSLMDNAKTQDDVQVVIIVAVDVPMSKSGMKQCEERLYMYIYVETRPVKTCRPADDTLASAYLAEQEIFIAETLACVHKVHIRTSLYIHRTRFVHRACGYLCGRLTAAKNLISSDAWWFVYIMNEQDWCCTNRLYLNGAREFFGVNKCVVYRCANLLGMRGPNAPEMNAPVKEAWWF